MPSEKEEKEEEEEEEEEENKKRGSHTCDLSLCESTLSVLSLNTIGEELTSVAELRLGSPAPNFGGRAL